MFAGNDYSASNMFPGKWNKGRRSGLEPLTEPVSHLMTNEPRSASPDAVSRSEMRRPRVVISTAPRFPDVLAEITRAQPLTMLAVAFVAGMILAAGWRR
jgi:hypothetical protein